MRIVRIPVLMFLIGSGVIFAELSAVQESVPIESSPQKEETTSEGETETSPSDSKKPEFNPLEALQRVLGGMKVSAERMKVTDPSDQTRAMQKQVIKDLDELIQHLEEQSANNQSPPPDQSPSQDQQPMDQEPMGKQQPQAQPQNSTPPGKPQPQQQRPSQEEGKSRESTERKDSPPPPSANRSLSGQQLYEKEVWGHLPPSVRRELMNVYSEKYIPQYEDLVRRYYESLAEGNRRKKPRP